MSGVLRVLTLADACAWRTALPASASAFGSLEYAGIYQGHTGYPARLAVYELDLGTVAYPFFLRPVDALPFSGRVPGTLWDTLSPEFTGPFAQSWAKDAPPDLVQEDQAGAAAAWHEYCRAQGIVAEFAHLHPWRPKAAHPTAQFLDASDVEFNREIVWVDLELSQEQWWSDSFDRSCRKNIRRAIKEGVRVYPAETLEDVREFHRIYTLTMERADALERYRFPFEYFGAFFERMPEHARFMLAEYEGQVVAATLYLHDDENVYSYLGGADHEHQHVRPTNAVVYETLLWAKAQGKKRLILGGGYQENDGIFRFKASFSPLRARFQVYKHVHLPEPYAALCEAWQTEYGLEASATDYFPAYRFVPVPSGREQGAGTVKETEL